MKARSSSPRSDPAYGAALVQALQRAHPRLTRYGLARLLGLSPRHLRKLEYMQKELRLPLQLWLESKLDPAIVRDLRRRYPPPPPPYWLARLGDHR